MIKNIMTLTLNDLAISFKNKTIFLIFFIPLFVFFTLKLVDSPNKDFQKIHIGLIKDESYPPVVVQSMKSAQNLFVVRYVTDENEGKKEIKEKKLDALLLKSAALLVLKKASISTLATIESFKTLQTTVEGKRTEWISEVKALQDENAQTQSLPTWILMLILLVAFIIMPSQVAEEKEKRLLLALLQTPMREIEWLMAKVLLSMILVFTTLILLHFLGDFSTGLNWHYMFLIIIGSFCFSSYGVMLGFLCRNQASARILGVAFYLPHLLPSALSDFSKKLDTIAPFLPSYQLYESIKFVLFDQGKITGLAFESIYLFIVGMMTFMISYWLIKKRWLM